MTGKWGEKYFFSIEKNILISACSAAWIISHCFFNDQNFPCTLFGDFNVCMQVSMGSQSVHSEQFDSGQI